MAFFIMEKLFKNKYRIESCRLKGWDYSWPGYYFVTICIKDKICYLGEVRNYKMYLSDIGEITVKCWREIPKHFPFIILDEYIVMPNHIHGILMINTPVLVETQNFASLYEVNIKINLVHHHNQQYTVAHHLDRNLIICLRLFAVLKLVLKNMQP